MVTLEQIRKRLVVAIEESGLTQTEIAKAMGVTQSTIAQYKMGRSLPALDTLANLCKILDVSPAYILCFEDEAGRKVLNTKDREVFIYEDGTHKITHKK